MPQVINRETLLTTQELEDLLKSKDWTDVRKQKARLEHQRRVFVARRQEQLQRHPALSHVGSVISAGLNYGEQAGLGLPSAIMAAPTAPLDMLTRGISFRDAYGLARERAKMILGASPVAQTVGTLGAFVAPTPARLAATRGFRMAGGALLAKRAAQAPTLTRAAAYQLSSALAGGAGSIATVNVAEGLIDERSAAEVIQDIGAQVTSPTNIILSVGGAGVATAARAVPDRALVSLVDKAKRLLPGFRTTPDMLRAEGGFVSGLIDSLSVSPAGRRAVAQFMRDSFFKPLRNAVDDMRQAITPGAVTVSGARRTYTTAAARDIRGLLVSETAEGAGKGIIGQRIEAAGRRGFAEAERRGDIVSRDQLAVLLRTLRSLENRARRQGGTEGPRGADFRAVISGRETLGSLRNVLKEANKAVKAGRPHNVTPRMLDNIRQRLAPIARYEASQGARGINAPFISNRDVRDAKMMYRAIRETLRRSSPPIDTALREIRELRAANVAFKPIAEVAHTGDDIALVRSMFTAKNFGRRWDEAKGLLTEPQLQRIRGAYCAEFLEEVMLRQGVRSADNFTLNARRMEDLFRGKGGPQFRRTVFDRVLPGIRHEITDLADVSDLVMKTIGRAEGSATARRLADQALVAGAADTLGLAVSSIKDPSLAWKLVGRLLGVPGVFVFTESLINGRVADALNRAASGGVLQPGRIAPAAVTQAGGLSNLGRASLQAGQNVAGGLGALAGAVQSR